jgi:predicted NBD/HSP70 family sugar kinase
VADLSGVHLGSCRQTLGIRSDSAEARRQSIAAGVDAALAAAGRGREDVLSLCVGVPAPVDANGGSPVHWDGFWQRMNPCLRDLFSTWVPLVRVENDAALAAQAEGATGAAQGCPNYVSLMAGARLGAGVVIDGQLLRGAHGGVGEMVFLDWVDGVGSADGLGVRAARWAQEEVAAKALSPHSGLAGVAPEAIDGKLVFDLAAAGDPDAVRVADRVGRMLARVTGVLACMFNPQMVIVSGALASGIEHVVAVAQQYLPTGLDLPAPQVVASTLGADVVVEGALAAARATARTHALDIWLPRHSAPGERASAR